MSTSTNLTNSPDGLSVARRSIIIGAGVFVSSFIVPSRPTASEQRKNLVFKIIRDDSDVGRYHVNFTSDGADLKVQSEVDIAIKVAFITAFRYKQTVDARWEGDHLVQSSITTDDDGKIGNVAIQKDNGKLAIEGPSGPLEAPLGTMTDASLWNMAIINEKHVIDGERGDLMGLSGTGPVDETLEFDGTKVATKRYTFESDASHNLSGTLWYDDESNLAKFVLNTRGEILTYLPLS